MSGRPSIVRRLVLVIVTTGLVVGVLGALVLQALERGSLIEEAQSRNRAAAARTATLIDSRVDAIASKLSVIASRERILPTDADAAAELATVLRASEQLDLLVLHDLVGRPVAAAAAAGVVALDEIDPRPPPEGDRGTAVLRPDGADSAVEVRVYVYDPPGTRVGWLVGSVPLTLLTTELAVELGDSGVSSALLAPDGTIVVHREFQRVVEREALDVDGLFPGATRTAEVMVDGEARLLGGATLRSLPGWVVTEQTRQQALAPIGERVAARTILLAVVLFAVMIVVVAAGRRLLRPLGPLADAVERIGAGERGVRVEVGATGEVAVLADGIDRMARSLEQRQDELRHAEETARSSEERFRLMIEGVEDYAIVLLAPDATIRTWNTGARRLLGYDPEQVLGRPLHDMFDVDESPPDPIEIIADVGRSEVEGWCRRSDGRRFWAAIAASHLADDAGRTYGIAVILHDLTERRAAREAMEAALEREHEAAEELRRANELKDEFLAIAAHEIRTPLSVILGASRLLGGDVGQLDPEDANRVRAMIETHADDLRAIVDRLLDFTRLQAGKVRVQPELVDLRSEVTDHVRSLAHHLADHQVVLDVEPTRVTVDRAALRHVVTNLLSNAAKFSPRGTTVTVTAEVDDGQLVIAVQDEGVGVASSDQERIFELFRHATREVMTARGTGVGLAIVKRYVEMLGGAITVTSAPGKGSLFTVTIPVGG